MTTKYVPIGTDDEISITLVTVEIVDGVETDVPIPFVDNSVSDIRLLFDDKEVTYIDNPDKISFDNEGTIKFKLGATADVSKGRSYQATVVAHDSAFPQGQTLVAPWYTDSNLNIIFK